MFEFFLALFKERCSSFFALRCQLNPVYMAGPQKKALTVKITSVRITDPIILQELAFPVATHRPSCTNSHLRHLSKRGPSLAGSGYTPHPMSRLIGRSNWVGSFHSRSGGSGQTVANSLVGIEYKAELTQEYVSESNVPLEFSLLPAAEKFLCQ